MAGHNMVVIGASAGGVEALSRLVGKLPAELPAAVFVVLHVSPHAPSLLPAILTRQGALPAEHGVDGRAIEPGRIYIAPPDHHLLLEDGVMRVIRGPKENRHRPAIDPLFRSAARFYGPRVVGVVLTGSLDDGTAGLVAVKRRGGIAVVQNPDEALYPSMPRSATQHVDVDFVRPLDEIAPLLVELSRRPAVDEGAYPVPDDMKYETNLAAMDRAAMQTDDRPGHPSGYACPDCKGVLYEIDDGHLTRFRCRVGHAFSADNMLAAHSDSVETALWIALNTLEESTNLSRRMAQQADERGQSWLSSRFRERAEETEQRADVLRRVLLQAEGFGTQDLREAEAREMGASRADDGGGRSASAANT